jgi:hypothetical protein
MQFFGKLISRPKGPAAPQPLSGDYAIAIDTLAALAFAHHRLVGLLMVQLVAVTPVDRRRDLINTLYSGIDRSQISRHFGFTGASFDQIGREADEISNSLIDAIAVAVGERDRTLQ